MRPGLRVGPSFLNSTLSCFATGLLLGLFGAGTPLLSAQEIDASVAASVASPSTRVNRMLLLLDPGAEKRATLEKFLTAQQKPGNAAYHQWLTPAQFAERFAVSAAEAATVTTWLSQQGLTAAALPAGRGWIEFSGTTAQVEKAFGAKIKSYIDVSTGNVRYRLAGEAQIPAAIALQVKGLVSLDGALATASVTHAVPVAGTASVLAAETSLVRAQALTPSLASAWLGFGAHPSSGGAGQSIAIPARSTVRTEDFTAFRKSFGLPESALEVPAELADIAERTADEAAVMQAVSWAGVAAPEARIVLVPVASTNATDGLDLALAAAIDGHLANTVSIGYSACERALSAAHAEFYAALYRQAAAQGISVIAATGDSGAAACHLSGDATPVRTGRDVNALASTPWNTAAGAVAFSISRSSLIGWGSSAYAAGGGASRLYVTPDWQSAAGLPASDPGTPAAHHRYVPDLSLPTADFASGLAFCFSGETAAQGCRLVRAGGSAVSAALLAGLSARLAEKYGPQGNLAPNLYALRRSDSAAFLDVTAGSAKLPCVVGTADCGTTAGAIGFDAGVGYDLVSGLGTVNGQHLVDNWATPQATGTTTPTVQMTNIGGLTYNPSANIVLSAKVLSGSGGVVPTGTVQFADQTNGQNTGTPVTLASDGTASYTEPAQFSIGGHNIIAKYSGDSVYAAGQSQPVTINIQPSATALVVSSSTTTPAAGSSVTVTGTLTAINPGDTPPTGSLTVNLDGIAKGTQRFTTTAGETTATVNVTIPSGGSHTIQGTYSGDINYNNSTSSSVTITVAKGDTVTSIAATPSTLTTGVNETFTATVAPSGAAAGDVFNITGTVSFYDGGATLLGTAPISSNTAILTGIALSNTADHTVTARYSGDTSYSASVSSPLLLTSTLLPVTVTLTSSSPVWTPEQSVALTATVNPVNAPPATSEQNPSGFVFFYAGNTLISGQIPVAQGPGYSGVASTFVPHLLPGQYVVTARYSGDPTYGAAVSNSINLQVEDFTVISNTTNIDVIQGQTGQAVFTVSSLGGLTGPIQLACEEQNPPQNGAIQCSFPAPSIVNGSGTATLTVLTSSGAIARNNDRKSPFAPVAGGGIALALAGLVLPIGKRAGWLRRGGRGGKLMLLAVLLAGMIAANVGCSNSVTLNTTRGTPLGVHTLKITAASYVNTVTVSHYAYLTVNVKS